MERAGSRVVPAKGRPGRNLRALPPQRLHSPLPSGGQRRAAQRMTSFIVTFSGCCPCSGEPCVDWRLWVQLAVRSAAGAIAAAVAGLAPGPVPTGLGAGVGRGVTVVAAGLAAVPPSRGLAALSAFGPHLASSVSVGLQWLDQVGLETETRATVTSGAGLAAVGTLAETRAAAGDGIGPSRKCPPPRGSGRRDGKNAAYCIIETRAGSERATPGRGRGQPILCEHYSLFSGVPSTRAF